MKPSMSIGRNYRLELEKLLRKINRSREHRLSLKILDEQHHLIRPLGVVDAKIHEPNADKPKMKTKINRTSTAGVVPLMVSHNFYEIYYAIMSKISILSALDID